MTADRRTNHAGLTRFLGDTPLRVAIRLVVLSFVVGLVLSALGIRPYEIYWWVERTVLHIYDMGFAFFDDSLDYLIAGALIVVPIFLISRLLKSAAGAAPSERSAGQAGPPVRGDARLVFRLAVPMTLAYPHVAAARHRRHGGRSASSATRR